MKKENYTELTTEELLKTKKSLTALTGLLAGALIILFVIAISTIKKGFTVQMIIPFAFFPILAINFSQVTAINKELKSRDANQ